MHSVLLNKNMAYRVVQDAVYAKMQGIAVDHVS